MKMKKRTKVIAIYSVGASLKSARKLADRHDLEVIDEIELIGMSASDNRSRVPEIDMLIRKLRNHEIEGILVSELDRFPSLNRAAIMMILEGLVEAKGQIYTKDQVFELGTRDGLFEIFVRIISHEESRRRLKHRSISARAKKRQERAAQILEDVPMILVKRPNDSDANRD
jgi:hypothetical protein